METVKGKTLHNIENGKVYKGCTFYLEEPEYVVGTIFDNCSFRTDFYVTAGHTAIFTNCNFNGEVQLFMEQGEQDMPPVGLIPHVKHLALAKFGQIRMDFLRGHEWSKLESIKFMLCVFRDIPNRILINPTLRKIQMDEGYLLYSQMKNTRLTLTIESTGEVFQRQCIEKRPGVLELTPPQLIGYTKGVDSGKNDIVFS